MYAMILSVNKTYPIETSITEYLNYLEQNKDNLSNTTK